MCQVKSSYYNQSIIWQVVYILGNGVICDTRSPTSFIQEYGIVWSQEIIRKVHQGSIHVQTFGLTACITSKNKELMVKVGGNAKTDEFDGFPYLSANCLPLPVSHLSPFFIVFL
jgi:hypothetical protein